MGSAGPTDKVDPMALAVHEAPAVMVRVLMDKVGPNVRRGPLENKQSVKKKARPQRRAFCLSATAH
jgi:hypothetical protein